MVKTKHRPLWTWIWKELKKQFGSLHISGLLLHIYQTRGRLDVLYFLWLYNSR